MHRSGTSLTAEWLQSCGVVLSVRPTLGPPSAENPRGHFEDPEFVAANSNAILAKFPQSKGWVVEDFQAPRLLELGDDAAGLVDYRNESFPVWGWKDPRSILLLDAWNALIPDLKVFFVWRPCHEVVRSLRRRCRFAPAQHFLSISAEAAEKLWLISATETIRWMKAHAEESLLFSLDHLLEHDEEVTACINKRFGLTLRHEPISLIFHSTYLHRVADSCEISYHAPAEVEAATKELHTLSSARIA